MDMNAKYEWIGELKDECWVETNLLHQWLCSTNPSQPLFERMRGPMSRESWRAIYSA